MAYTLYADTDEMNEPPRDGEGSLEWMKRTGYCSSWHQGAKSIRDCDWLDEHVRGSLMFSRLEPDQAVVVGKALGRQVGAHAFDEGDAGEARRLLEVSSWLKYWGRTGVPVRGAP